MTARIWGAHAPRVRAMTPPSSRTFSSSFGAHRTSLQEDRFGEGAETSPRGAYAPRITAAAQVNLTR
jgi:hypothetical protein